MKSLEYVKIYFRMSERNNMITYKIISKTGGRVLNEDCTGMHQLKSHLGFFLADGLGGHGKGEIASKIAVEQGMLQFEDKGACLEGLKAVFEGGQKAILEHQKQEGCSQGMKTTLTALLTDGKNFYRGHIGDSRIYYFKNNSLVERTMDHSVPQMLVAAGEIKENQIRNHPDRNRLLRVMGIEWDRPMYQILEAIPVKGKQAFLMCSDGFWELIDEKEMVKCLKRAKTVEQWVEFMEGIVNRKGVDKNMDNYSAVAVWSSTGIW